MLKILQAILQQYMNQELQDVQIGVRKGRRTRDQTANMCWIIEEAREFKKNIYFCFIDCAKVFDCVDHSKLWKILQEIGIPDHHLPAFWEICVQVKKQQLESDMEQCTGSKLGKKNMSMLYTVILLIELICRVHHSKFQAAWNTSWNQDCQEKYQ